MIVYSRKIKFMNVNHILSCTSVYLRKNLNKAIKLYRRRGYIMRALLIVHAVSTELTQLYDIETVLNIDNSETSRKDTAESLEYLMLLTQKGT